MTTPSSSTAPTASASTSNAPMAVAGTSSRAHADLIAGQDGDENDEEEYARRMFAKVATPTLVHRSTTPSLLTTAIRNHPLPAEQAAMLTSPTANTAQASTAAFLRCGTQHGILRNTATEHHPAPTHTDEHPRFQEPIIPARHQHQHQHLVHHYSHQQPQSILNHAPSTSHSTTTSQVPPPPVALKDARRHSMHTTTTLPMPPSILANPGAKSSAGEAVHSSSPTPVAQAISPPKASTQLAAHNVTSVMSTAILATSPTHLGATAPASPSLYGLARSLSPSLHASAHAFAPPASALASPHPVRAALPPALQSPLALSPHYTGTSGTDAGEAKKAHLHFADAPIIERDAHTHRDKPRERGRAASPPSLSTLVAPLRLGTPVGAIKPALHSPLAGPSSAHGTPPISRSTSGNVARVQGETDKSGAGLKRQTTITFAEDSTVKQRERGHETGSAAPSQTMTPTTVAVAGSSHAQPSSYFSDGELVATLWKGLQKTQAERIQQQQQQELETLSTASEDKDRLRLEREEMRAMSERAGLEGDPRKGQRPRSALGWRTWSGSGSTSGPIGAGAKSRSAEASPFPGSSPPDGQSVVARAGTSKSGQLNLSSLGMPGPGPVPTSSPATMTTFPHRTHSPARVGAQLAVEPTPMVTPLPQPSSRHIQFVPPSSPPRHLRRRVAAAAAAGGRNREADWQSRRRSFQGLGLQDREAVHTFRLDAHRRAGTESKGDAVPPGTHPAGEDGPRRDVPAGDEDVASSDCALESSGFLDGGSSIVVPSSAVVAGQPAPSTIPTTGSSGHVDGRVGELVSDEPAGEEKSVASNKEGQNSSSVKAPPAQPVASTKEGQGKQPDAVGVLPAGSITEPILTSAPAQPIAQQAPPGSNTTPAPTDGGRRKSSIKLATPPQPSRGGDGGGLGPVGATSAASASASGSGTASKASSERKKLGRSPAPESMLAHIHGLNWQMGSGAGTRAKGRTASARAGAYGYDSHHGESGGEGRHVRARSGDDEVGRVGFLRVGIGSGTGHGAGAGATSTSTSTSRRYSDHHVYGVSPYPSARLDLRAHLRELRDERRARLLRRSGGVDESPFGDVIPGVGASGGTGSGVVSETEHGDTDATGPLTNRTTLLTPSQGHSQSRTKSSSTSSAVFLRTASQARSRSRPNSRQQRVWAYGGSPPPPGLSGRSPPADGGDDDEEEQEVDGRGPRRRTSRRGRRRDGGGRGTRRGDGSHWWTSSSNDGGSGAAARRRPSGTGSSTARSVSVSVSGSTSARSGGGRVGDGGSGSGIARTRSAMSSSGGRTSVEPGVAGVGEEGLIKGGKAGLLGLEGEDPLNGDGSEEAGSDGIAAWGRDSDDVSFDDEDEDDEEEGDYTEDGEEEEDGYEEDSEGDDFDDEDNDDDIDIDSDDEEDDDDNDEVEELDGSDDFGADDDVDTHDDEEEEEGSDGEGSLDRTQIFPLKPIRKDAVVPNASTGIQDGPKGTTRPNAQGERERGGREGEEEGEDEGDGDGASSLLAPSIDSRSMAYPASFPMDMDD